MSVIDEDGNELVWTAVYWRHHSRMEYEADDFAEAYLFLVYGEEEGDLCTEAIIGPDGKVVMTTEQFSAAYRAGWTPEQAHLVETAALPERGAGDDDE